MDLYWRSGSGNLYSVYRSLGYISISLWNSKEKEVTKINFRDTY